MMTADVIVQAVVTTIVRTVTTSGTATVTTSGTATAAGVVIAMLLLPLRPAEGAMEVLHGRLLEAPRVVMVHTVAAPTMVDAVREEKGVKGVKVSVVTYAGTFAIQETAALGMTVGSPMMVLPLLWPPRLRQTMAMYGCKYRRNLVNRVVRAARLLGRCCHLPLLRLLPQATVPTPLPHRFTLTVRPRSRDVDWLGGLVQRLQTLCTVMTQTTVPRPRVLK